SFKYLDPSIEYETALSRDDLINQIMQKIKSGEQVVIKPFGVGLGRGIEFFLDNEDENEIIKKVDFSIKSIENNFNIKNGSFPYTISKYIDATVINDINHQLKGHKYELRIIVYRHKSVIKAFPAIIKIAGLAYDKNVNDRLMLINNATAVSAKTNLPRHAFSLPLTNLKTLDTLGLNQEHLIEVCKFATSYINYCLNDVDKLEKECYKNYYSLNQAN
ncbi:MAG: hypothetical protein AB1782_07565, partial [Cyanobacteriota bacterium]